MENPQRKINETCIATIQKNGNGDLVKVDVEIPDSERAINDLRNIVENDNCDVMDLQRRFRYYIRFYQDDTYKLCLPYAYNDAYIKSKVKAPMEITDKEIEKKRYWATRDIRRMIYSRHKCYPDNLKEAVDNAMLAKEREWKNKRFEKYNRFIRCMQYYRYAVSIDLNPHIYLMYSREDIGWKEFNYDINEDVSISLCTNFCYGRSAYFIIIVRYKGVLYVPYSQVVRYYYANFYDLINYTRSYTPHRENWDDALEFVVNFVNTAKASPDKIIKEFFMKEIKEMVDGLTFIMRDPEQALEKVREVDNNDHEYTVLRSIRPMDDVEEEQYKLNKDEFVEVYKLFKISGSLGFLKGMRKFAEIVNEVNQYILQIEGMNRELYPSALSLKNRIKADIDKTNGQIQDTQGVIDELEKKVLPLEEKLKLKLEEIPDSAEEGTKEKTILEFEEEYPEYAELKKALKKQNDELNKLQHHYDLRMNLYNRVNSYIESIEKFLYFVISHNSGMISYGHKFSHFIP